CFTSVDIQIVGHKQHESMDPSCLVTMVQAGGCGVMVWGIFSRHTLGPLVPIENRLNATAYLTYTNIIADQLYPLIKHFRVFAACSPRMHHNGPQCIFPLA
uniref:Uncharacterized protein n=1 Tax=Leptobrachium leishanense TaxID=445787 RepID=A0A8C5WD86_9ANUR